MVAILGGLLAFAVFMIAGLVATIRVQRDELRELREANRPPTSPPFSVIRAREDVLDDCPTDPDLPPLFDIEGNDEPTKVCRFAP